MLHWRPRVRAPELAVAVGRYLETDCNGCSALRWTARQKKIKLIRGRGVVYNLDKNENALTASLLCSKTFCVLNSKLLNDSQFYIVALCIEKTFSGRPPQVENKVSGSWTSLSSYTTLRCWFRQYFYLRQSTQAYGTYLGPLHLNHLKEAFTGQRSTGT